MYQTNMPNLQDSEDVVETQTGMRKGIKFLV